MKLHDTQPLRGELTLVIKRRGYEPETITEHNMIMNIARDALAKLIAGQGAGKSINRIGFGTGSTGPSPDDTALTSAYIKSVGAISFPSAGQVTFSFSLAESEANGKSIREFGLLCSDGSLFSRKVRGVIEKSDDLSLSGTWTIIF